MFKPSSISISFLLIALFLSINSASAAIIDIPIASGSDDVEEHENNGRVDSNSPSLILVNQNRWKNTVGLRFNELFINPGSTITNAYVQFSTYKTSADPTTLIIEGEASGNAPAFTSTRYSVSTLPRTANSATWSPAPWNNIGDAGPDQRSSNLAGIIQELVNRTDWNPGNSVVLLISGDGYRVAPTLRLALLGHGE